MFDVAVVGAGCVGSYLAHQLVRRGLNVLVLERDASVGDSVNCSGIIGAEAFSTFELPRETIQAEIRTLSVFGPSGRSVEYASAVPMAYMVDRLAFDQELARRALCRGVAYSLGSWVCGIEKYADHVRLDVQTVERSEKVEAKVCVLATGFAPKLLQKAGLPVIGEFIQGVQFEARMDNVPSTEIHLGNEVAPASFAWVVPAGDGRCKVGLLARQGAGDLLRKFAAGPMVRSRLNGWDGKFKASLIPMEPLPRSCTERILVVGEAAGQVKPTTAGGIYYGLLCAQIAAEELGDAFACGDFSAERLRRYERRWKKLLAREYRFGKAFLNTVSKMSDREIDALIELSRVDGVIPLVRRFFRFDWHSSLISKLLLNYLAPWVAAWAADSEAG